MERDGDREMWMWTKRARERAESGCHLRVRRFGRHGTILCRVCGARTYHIVMVRVLGDRREVGVKGQRHHHYFSGLAPSLLGSSQIDLQDL
jgi:hypothetical protein